LFLLGNVEGALSKIASLSSGRDSSRGLLESIGRIPDFNSDVLLLLLD